MRARAWVVMMITVHAVLISLSLESSEHEIVSLPGQPEVSFKQYSGYITVDSKQQRALFYYFVEAETDPASKPLVLWLNGGPGCSSVGIGAFMEHGPFKPSGGVLIRNDYSWNKEANMVYLESPAGVGFSYSANRTYYDYVDDEMTARDNFAFLLRWFDKFPAYRNRDLFITGESYAGHYALQLAQLILESDTITNLKAIAIGNPLLDFDNDFNSHAQFLWSHGLISDSAYEAFNTVCNYSQIGRQSLQGFLTPECLQVYTQVLQESSSEYINGYDVTSDVCLSSTSSALSQSSALIHLVRLNALHSKLQNRLGYADACIEDKTDKYLNRKDVQKAMHARLAGVSKWTKSSDILQYDQLNLLVPTTDILLRLVKSGMRIFVYSGDQDSTIPLMGTRTLVDLLAKKLGLRNPLPYRAWFEGRQVGGWTQVYNHLLSYATIRGASHEAPLSQPERSLALFKAFLAGKQLPGLQGKQHPDLASSVLQSFFF